MFKEFDILVDNKCSSARYHTHLYRLAVHAGFYSDTIECWISTQEILVRRKRSWFDPRPGQKVISILSPVTFGAQRKMARS